MTLRVRPSAKAIIIRDQHLLVIVRNPPEGEHFILPGGGQEHGETLEQAVKRECLEEVGLEVRVGALLYVRDYIGRNHGYKHDHPDFHGLEMMFECFVADDAEPSLGSNPDTNQSGVRWLPLASLETTSLYPKEVRGLIARQDRSRLYLGDIN
jgi:8-oxo-dGTP diphosphatase